MTERKMLRMVGPPRSIHLLDPIEQCENDFTLISKQKLHNYCADDRLPCRTKKPKNGKPMAVKMRMPADTAPGDYPAQLVAGDHSFDVMISVEPRAKMRVLPKTLTLTGKPGTTLKTNLALENLGNVSINIPDKIIGNAFDFQAIPAAFAYTLQADESSEQTLSDKLLSELKHGYGGVVKGKLTGKASPLAVSQREAFELALTVPEQAEPGKSYTVILHINEFHYLLNLQVI